MKKIPFLYLALILALSSSGCVGDERSKVVVYTSRDQYYAEPILKDFENETGIAVLAVYDTGVTKTAGLMNRIIAEKANPQADVFWNSETSRTIILKNEDVLEPYVSENGKDIPLAYKDKDGYWSGFAARARVIIYNTGKMRDENAPHSIFDFIKPQFSGRLCVGRGWLGTMATHNAALFNLLGDSEAKEYFRKLGENKVRLLVGNTEVRDAVSSGECDAGLIDSSDAQEAISYGKPIAIIYPDQKPDEIGALMIPNSIALINGGPNPENGRKFIDYMLRKSTEQKLAYSVSSQIPLRQGIPKPPHVKGVSELKLMEVDYEKSAAKMNESNEFLLDLFTTEQY